MPRCSICRAEGHNKRKCSQTNAPPPSPQLEPKPEPKPEYDYPMGEQHQQEGNQPEPKPETKPGPQLVLTQKPPLTQKWWVCAYCHLPIGNDHRMCICQAFNYSVDAWKAAAIQYGQELLDAGTHPMS